MTPTRPPVRAGDGPLPPAPERILVVKLGALGDVVQAAGAVRDVRENFPAARISVLTTPAFRALFARCPWVDAVLTDPRAPRWRLDEMARLRRALREERFDAVFDLQTQARTAFYRRWLLPGVPWVGRRVDPRTAPAAERFARQLADAGLTVRHSLAPDVRWMADDASDALAAAGVAGPYAVLIPTASARHPGKRWPGYPELAARLRAAGRTVVTVPGPGEEEACRAVPGAVLTEADGRCLSLFRLAGVLAGAEAVVGNDTGPTHIAARLGVPGVALFGPHASAFSTGIGTGSLRVLEVPDLAALPAGRVEAELELALAGAGAAGARAGEPAAR